MSIQTNESLPSITSFGHDWGLSTPSSSTTINSTSSSSKHNQHSSVDKLAAVHSSQNTDFHQSVKKQGTSSDSTVNTTIKKPFSTGIPSNLQSVPALVANQANSTSSINCEATTVTSNSTTSSKSSCNHAITLTPSAFTNTDRSSSFMASSASKYESSSGNMENDAASPPPEQVLKSTNEFPPLPTQKDASPPSPPQPNGESYAQATKHNIASEIEESTSSSKPRKRPRNHPSSTSSEDGSTSKGVVAARTGFGVGVVAVIIGRLLLNRPNQQGGRPLMVGGVVTAFLSGLSWIWLRRSTSQAK